MTIVVKCAHTQVHKALPNLLPNRMEMNPRIEQTRALVALAHRMGDMVEMEGLEEVLVEKEAVAR